MIDTDKLSGLLNGAIAKFLGISAQESRELYKKFIQKITLDDSTDYDPWNWLNFLSDKFPKVSKEELEAVFLIRPISKPVFFLRFSALLKK